MKTSFEKTIKDRLQNFEMPFDEAAWEQLHKNINNNKRKKFLLKGYIILLSIISISSLLFLATNNHESKNILVSSLNNKSSKKDSSSKKNQTEINQNSIGYKATINENKVIIENKTMNEKTPFESKNENNKLSLLEVSFLNKSSNSEDNDGINQNKYILPFISSLCLGEEKTITNNSDLELIIKQPNGIIINVSNFSNYNFKAEQIGEHTLAYSRNNEIIHASSFQVLHVEEINFEIDNEALFKHGIPLTTLETSVFSNNIKWYLDSELLNTSKSKIELNIFKKGTYTIKLTTDNNNGCLSLIEQKITINEDYNLLAVNAFSPNSSNDKTNSFIPYALVERDVKFNFIIIDPKNGSIIYETNDKLKPWNGIDYRTGNLVEINSNWVWKVVIENPLKGEDSNYKGIIIRL